MAKLKRRIQGPIRYRSLTKNSVSVGNGEGILPILRVLVIGIKSGSQHV